MRTTEKIVTILVAIYKAKEFISSKIINLSQQTIFNKCNIVLLNCQNLGNEQQLYNEFLLKHNNVSEIFYEDHIRLYSTWNDGIKQTNSKYICNANVDDLWKPDYLEKCVEFLENNQKYSCVSSRILITRKANQVDYNKWRYDHKMPPYTYPTSTAGPCPIWRRSLHEKYGYFGNYRTIGDAKLWEKWHNNGELFGFLNQDLVLYYASGSSLERRIDATTQKSFRNLDLEDENNQKI